MPHLSAVLKVQISIGIVNVRAVAAAEQFAIEGSISVLMSVPSSLTQPDSNAVCTSQSQMITTLSCWKEKKIISVICLFVFCFSLKDHLIHY